MLKIKTVKPVLNKVFDQYQVGGSRWPMELCKFNVWRSQMVAAGGILGVDPRKAGASAKYGETDDLSPKDLLLTQGEATGLFALVTQEGLALFGVYADPYLESGAAGISLSEDAEIHLRATLKFQNQDEAVAFIESGEITQELVKPDWSAEEILKREG